MITYTYKCKECSQYYNVDIQTIDIIDKVGRVNQEELEKRMYEPRQCKCGGELFKVINKVTSALWFNEHKLKGKISQRFA